MTNSFHDYVDWLKDSADAAAELDAEMEHCPFRASCSLKGCDGGFYDDCDFRRDEHVER